MIFGGLTPFDKSREPVGLATEGWLWYTSTRGWTNDFIAYEWITKVFQPATVLHNRSQRRLLIMDGHGSHLRGRFLAYCMRPP